MFEPVTSKQQMYDLFMRGAFGNRLRNWGSLRSLLADDFTGKVGLRSRFKVGGQFIPNIAKELVPYVVQQAQRDHGIPETAWLFSEMAPDEHITIQGEVWRSTEGLYLRYSRVKRPMREALATEQHHVHGLRAKLMLEHWLCHASLDNILLLLDNYEDHVVEFSSYSILLGSLHHNTIVWEVRLGQQQELGHDKGY